MRIPSFLFLIALLLAGALTTYAQTTIATTDVPQTISYQGLLTSTDGAPFADGQYDVTVTLYGDEGGTQPIWQQTYTTAVTAGVFNLYLGSAGKPLPATTELNTALWIGTSVNGGPEMRPLTPLSASPYALNVPDKAITAEKVDMDYISELRIDGEKVSGKGTVLNLMSTPTVPLSYDATTKTVTVGQAATGQKGDDEKGPGVLATNMDVWTMRGDGRSFSPGFPAIVPGLGDWIGTSNAIDFIIKVNGQQTMQYQQTGAFAIPNIIGGQGNTVTAATSVASIIAGGNGSSMVTGNYDVIAGGQGNTMEQTDHSAIGGGENNGTSYGDHNATGGGSANVVYYGNHGAIAGGENNSIDNTNHGAIGGGYFNTMLYGDYNTIGGGSNNLVFSPGGYAINGVTISGGQNNRAEIDYTTIGGGSDNAITATNPGMTEYSTIGGGSNNLIDGISQRAVIAGGMFNRIVNAGDFGAIGGGEYNELNREYGTISGGQGNFIDDTSPYATIGGGSANSVLAGGEHSTVSGGNGNSVGGPYGTIAGGVTNSSDANSIAVAIGGGSDNTITVNGRYATIGGGGSNSIEDQYGTISGGRNNSIDNTSQVATIAGGRDNVINNNGDFSTVGGGERNNAQGSYTTIPGGDNLLTNASYAQTAVGFYNAPRGSMAVRPSAGTIAASDAPLFMVGNGDVNAAVRSNAFEVSYNGHSVVHGELGPSPGPSAIVGATYADNVVYGWGEIDPLGGITSGFGIGLIAHPGVGVYTITLNIVDPITGFIVPLTNMAVTATLNDNSCAFINVVRNAAPINTFTVNIHNAGCLPVDLPFTFHVTGRR